MKESEAGHKRLKSFEKLARDLRTVANRLSGSDKRRAARLAELFDSLYTSVDKAGTTSVLTKDGKMAASLELRESEAHELLKQVGARQ